MILNMILFVIASKLQTQTRKYSVVFDKQGSSTHSHANTLSAALNPDKHISSNHERTVITNFTVYAETKKGMEFQVTETSIARSNSRANSVASVSGIDDMNEEEKVVLVRTISVA